MTEVFFVYDVSVVVEGGGEGGGIADGGSGDSDVML